MGNGYSEKREIISRYLRSFHLRPPTQGTARAISNNESSQSISYFHMKKKAMSKIQFFDFCRKEG